MSCLIRDVWIQGLHDGYLARHGPISVPLAEYFFVGYMLWLA